MALRARNASPWLLATLNTQSTCHGPRPGPTLAPWCSGGLLRAPKPRAREKTRGRNRKKMPMCRKNAFTHSNVLSQYCCTRNVEGQLSFSHPPLLKNTPTKTQQTHTNKNKSIITVHVVGCCCCLHVKPFFLPNDINLYAQSPS